MRSIRLNDQLYEKLRLDADAEGRTMVKQLERILSQEYFIKTPNKAYSSPKPAAEGQGK